MFQVHGYDAWLAPRARTTHFFAWSQILGTLPAPLFLFLAGVSCALVTNRARQKNIPEKEIAKSTIRRGFQIFGLGLLFRGQEYILGQPGALWTDLFRVDILNTIGISIALIGVVCWLARSRTASTMFAIVACAGIALPAPLLWTAWRPHWLPWYIESYVNGVHTFNKPQPWLFPIFPWSAFAFAGLAVGFLLFADWSKKRSGLFLTMIGVSGIGIFELSMWLDSRRIQIYPEYDYWHTSPNFFLARVGILLMLMALAYLWCRWGLATKGFSPLVQLGQTSLLVYWVHIEFVYGCLSILKKNKQAIPSATIGVLLIFVAMTLLSVARIRTKGRFSEIFASLRHERSIRPIREIVSAP
jgi:uncharacterized membrane protein